MAQSIGPDVTNEEIIERIRSGEVSAQDGFPTIVGRVTPYIWAMIRRTVKKIDDEQTAELAATVWSEVWRNIDTFNPAQRTAFTTWVSTIAHHKAVDYVRKTKATPEIDSLDEPPEGGEEAPALGEVQADPTVRTPLEEIVEKEVEVAALKALMEFDDFDRTLYLLYLSFDLKHEQLAEIASKARGKKVTVKAVQSRIYHTRDRLLALLRTRGVIETEEH